MQQNMDRELGWNDEIENEGEQWQPVPEGDYDFEVLSFERGRYNGGAKLPPCHMAVLKIQVDNGKDRTTLTHRLFLHARVEGMLCAFFTAIGQRKKGERISMNWNAVPGSRGRCRVSVRKWTGNDGQERSGNEISRFYEPPAAPQPQGGDAPPVWAAGYTPGTF